MFFIRIKEGTNNSSQHSDQNQESDNLAAGVHLDADESDNEHAAEEENQSDLHLNEESTAFQLEIVVGNGFVPSVYDLADVIVNYFRNGKTLLEKSYIINEIAKNLKTLKYVYGVDTKVYSEQLKNAISEASGLAWFGKKWKKALANIPKTEQLKVTKNIGYRFDTSVNLETGYLKTPYDNSARREIKMTENEKFHAIINWNSFVRNVPENSMDNNIIRTNNGTYINTLPNGDCCFVYAEIPEGKNLDEYTVKVQGESLTNQVVKIAMMYLVHFDKPQELANEFPNIIKFIEKALAFEKYDAGICAYLCMGRIFPYNKEQRQLICINMGDFVIAYYDSEMNEISNICPAQALIYSNPEGLSSLANVVPRPTAQYKPDIVQAILPTNGMVLVLSQNLYRCLPITEKKEEYITSRYLDTKTLNEKITKPNATSSPKDFLEIMFDFKIKELNTEGQPILTKMKEAYTRLRSGEHRFKTVIAGIPKSLLQLNTELLTNIHQKNCELSEIQNQADIECLPYKLILDELQRNPAIKGSNQAKEVAETNISRILGEHKLEDKKQRLEKEKSDLVSAFEKKKVEILLNEQQTILSQTDKILKKQEEDLEICAEPFGNHNCVVLIRVNSVTKPQLKYLRSMEFQKSMQQILALRNHIQHQMALLTSAGSVKKTARIERLCKTVEQKIAAFFYTDKENSDVDISIIDKVITEICKHMEVLSAFHRNLPIGETNSHIRWRSFVNKNPDMNHGVLAESSRFTFFASVLTPLSENYTKAMYETTYGMKGDLFLYPELKI